MIRWPTLFLFGGVCSTLVPLICCNSDGFTIRWTTLFFFFLVLEYFSTTNLSQFRRFYDPVASEIEQLRVILQGVEARALEREFLKQQYHGELDDSRLVDGAAGSNFGIHFTCFTSTKVQILTQKAN
jgi:hypothetical protein